MPTRHQHDPFISAPLRPTSLNPSVRAQASLAPSRPRPQRDLFAPALLRRPTSRATPRVADEVLADPNSDDDNATHQHLQQQRRLRRIRGASPLRPRGEEDVEIVNRQPDGGYLLGAKETNETIAALIWAPELQDAKVASELDSEYADKARSYFTSGTAYKGSKKQDEEYQSMAFPMMQHLREQALQRLDNERWQFEPVDRFQPHLP